MRDPVRIPRMLEAIRKVWEAHPDLRLGQLLVNAMLPSRPSPQVFYFEDDKLEPRIAAYPSADLPVHEADEVVLRLSRSEAVVLMWFLMRFRDRDQLAIEHPAEAQLLYDLAALVQQYTQDELGDSAWTEILETSRQAVLADETGLRVN